MTVVELKVIIRFTFSGFIFKKKRERKTSRARVLFHLFNTSNHLHHCPIHLLLHNCQSLKLFIVFFPDSYFMHSASTAGPGSPSSDLLKLLRNCWYVYQLGDAYEATAEYEQLLKSPDRINQNLEEKDSRFVCLVCCFFGVELSTIWAEDVWPFVFWWFSLKPNCLYSVTILITANILGRPINEISISVGLIWLNGGLIKGNKTNNNGWNTWDLELYPSESRLPWENQTQGEQTPFSSVDKWTESLRV